jgi:hypothetical protein
MIYHVCKTLLVLLLLSDIVFCVNNSEYGNSDNNQQKKMSIQNLEYDLLTATSYNWERKRIHRPGTFPIAPYPAVRNGLNPDTCIKLINGGNAPISIIKLVDTKVVGDKSAFIFDKTKLLGQTIKGNDSLIVKVEFQPQSTGEYEYTFEYITDNSSIEGVTTTLKGVGILPRLVTHDCDLGTTIVDDFSHPNANKIVLVNVVWQYNDSVTITGLYDVNVLNETTSEWSEIDESFRYDATQQKLPFPITLKPGQTLEIDPVEFVARGKGTFTGSITTISDAESEATSSLVGKGLQANASITGSSGIACKGQSYNLNVVISNSGETNLKIENLILSDTSHFKYVNESDTLGFILREGESRYIEITYMSTDTGKHICIFECVAIPFLKDMNEDDGLKIPLTADLMGETVHYSINTEVLPEIDTVKKDEFVVKKIYLYPETDLSSALIIGFMLNIRYNSNFLKLEYDSLNTGYNFKDIDKDGIILGNVFDAYPQGAFKIDFVNYDSINGSLRVTIKRSSGFDNVFFNSPDGGEFLVLTFKAFQPINNESYSSFIVDINPDDIHGSCVEVQSSWNSVVLFDSSGIEGNGIFIYPNPAKDILTVENLPTNCKKIEIYDLSGKKVKEIEVKNDLIKIEIPTNDMLQGYYILRFFPQEDISIEFFIIR